MEKNNTSRFSICRKIRQTLASNPAFRAIHHIKQHYYIQEPKPSITHSNSPSFPPHTHLPQHIKVNTEEGGAIPINFDYSTPGNGNKAISIVNGQSSKVVSPHVGASERTGKVAAKVEPETHYDVGKQQDKKKLDINDTFTEYIQRAKYRIRTVSNVGWGQSNSASDEDNGSGPNNMENQNDQFSEFIRHGKKKFRTTSNIGKTSSLKRG